MYKLYKSGSRFSRTQLARSCINIGYSADADNMVISTPIKNSLLEGLTEEEFFIVAPGTRKSIKDKARFTPDSGYLERTIVMALSILELDLDDCGSNRCLETIVSSQKHAMTLVGKWYKDPQKPSSDWEVLDLNKAKEFINRKIQIRSPMTCQAPKFKLCHKCFGTRKFPTKYVGITAGQNITERITQLILRTFHESGRADLEINKVIRIFLMEHLIDIKQSKDEKYNDVLTTLVFDTDQFPNELIDGSVLEFPQNYDYQNKTVTFGSNSQTIMNEDIVTIMNLVKTLVIKASKTYKQPVEYYQDLITLLLNVGLVYSSFIEMLFANMFLVGELEQKKFWRYHQDETPTYKLGVRMMSSYISPLLGLLYQPNKDTIEKIDINIEDFLTDDHDLTIYEKIWLNRI